MLSLAALKPSLDAASSLSAPLDRVAAMRSSLEAVSRLQASLDRVATLDAQLASVASLRSSMDELARLRAPLERVSALNDTLDAAAPALALFRHPLLLVLLAIAALAAWGGVTYLAVAAAIRRTRADAAVSRP
jgi:DNA mismatch repair ATPase MutS